MHTSSIRQAYPFCEYYVDNAELSADYGSLLEVFNDLVRRKITVKEFCSAMSVPGEASLFEEFIESQDTTKFGKIISEDAKRQLRDTVEVLFSKLVKNVAAQKMLASEFVNKLHGYKVIQPLLDDDDLEEIMVSGLQPIFVFHSKLGMCKTNLSFQSERDIREFLTQAGLSATKTLEDAKLADGSRLNVLSPPASPQVNVTIRKFRARWLTIIELIKNGTLTAELAAFLWVCVEGMHLYPLNILIVGGTASGKTTLLNALSAFVPPSDRIVSIEDTLELALFSKENWVQCRTSQGADAKTLLVNTLHMRPDRIIVGEVRGEEAATLFTAMNVGHRGVFATLHSLDAKDAVARLENYPMNVPRTLIPLVDIVLVQQRINDKKLGLIKRTTQVAELSRIEDIVAVHEIYEFNQVTKSIEPTDVPVQSKEKLAKAVGVTITAVNADIAQRRNLLEYMLSKDIRSPEDVNLFMEKYYGEVYAKKQK